MNKKTISIILFVVIIGIVGFIAEYKYFKKQDNNKLNNVNIYDSDTIKFKNEYEALNSVQNDDGTNKYMYIEIPEDSNIKYIDENQVINILEGGTGIIYFGMPECPWCRTMIVPLLEEVNKKGVTLYYYNPKEIRNLNTEEYQKIVEYLKDYLKTDTTTQKESDAGFDESKKRLYMPDVYFIRNGNVISSHFATVDSQENPKVQLNEEQINELKSIYNNLINNLYDNICNDEENSKC